METILYLNHQVGNANMRDGFCADPMTDLSIWRYEGSV